MRTRSYVIVRSSGEPLPGRRELRRAVRSHRPAGRHRLGRPGRVPRYLSRPRRPPFVRGRHRATVRHAQRSSTQAARYGTLVVLLSTVVASGWFAASGAAALAQMVQP